MNLYNISVLCDEAKAERKIVRLLVQQTISDQQLCQIYIYGKAGAAIPPQPCHKFFKLRGGKTFLFGKVQLLFRRAIDSGTTLRVAD